jgi:hypothetical protein
LITLQRLYQRDKGICHICTKRVQRLEDASREHVFPKFLGGTAGKRSENIKLAHKWCNQAKGSKLFRTEQHKNGWAIVDPNGKISDELYVMKIEADMIVDDLNRDKVYLDKSYE